jgi:hypothetical protein
MPLDRTIAVRTHFPLFMNASFPNQNFLISGRAVLEKRNGCAIRYFLQKTSIRQRKMACGIN